MEQFTLTVETTNDAFQPDPAGELAYILRALANLIAEERDQAEAAPIHDSNGNTVGHYAWQGEESV